MGRDRSSKLEVSQVTVEAAPEVDLEKLGRQRPAIFNSAWHEIAFIGSMLVALSMGDFLIGGFMTVLPGLVEPLDIPNASRTWPSSALTLVAGSFLFPCGRLADMFGGYVVFHGGLMYFILWTMAAGFSKNFITLVVCRAMQGLGAAMFLPAGVSLVGRIYRPGPRKNLIFSIYGALGPIGFFSGIIIGGMSQELLTWRYYFWFGSIISGICCIGSLFTCPRDYAEARKRGVSMDWWGLCTMVPSFILIIYAVTASRKASHGWASPEIIVTMTLGVLLLGATIYVEGWVAKAPLIPSEIFRVKYMKRMTLTLFLTWGVFGLYLFYVNFYIQKIIGKSSMMTAVWFAPWAGGGFILAISSGLVLHRLPGRVILVLSLVCQVIAVLLFALIPENPNYWAWIFPAMVSHAACADVLWTASNVFLTTSLPKRFQGLAGALINITSFVGGAFFLASVDAAVGKFESMGWDLRKQYKGVFWIGTAISSVALAICFFMDIGKAGSALTVDEMNGDEQIGGVIVNRNEETSDSESLKNEGGVVVETIIVGNKEDE